MLDEDDDEILSGGLILPPFSEIATPHPVKLMKDPFDPFADLIENMENSLHFSKEAVQDSIKQFFESLKNGENMKQFKK